MACDWKNDDWLLKGISSHIMSLREEIKKVAPKDISVLIEGPPGTGKELVAKELHKRSSRKVNKFITVDCGAIASELFESEMFGYGKGAFTGALSTGKKGYVEAANGGTLFLDEIGNLKLEHQGKLLRFLEEREYCRVGETTPIKADIRIISATNKNLIQESHHGKFREDLLDRLNVRVMKTIPLDERPVDLIYLLNYFSRTNKLKMNPKSKFLLYIYDFPGNVRELSNLIHNADDYQYLKDTILGRFAARIGKEVDELKNNSAKAYKDMVRHFEKTILDNDEFSQKKTNLLKIYPYSMK